MASAFHRSLLQLSQDGVRPAFHAGLAALLLATAWGGWFFFGRLPLLAVSKSARLEAERRVHVVLAPVDGEVRSVHAEMGRAVQAGAVLIEMDTVREKLLARENELSIGSTTSLIKRLKAQLALEDQSVLEMRTVVGSTQQEVLNRFREADELARAAEADAARGVRLHQAGLIPEAERLRLQTEARRARAAADSLRAALSRSSSEDAIAAATKLAAREKLRADLAAAEAAQSSARLTAQRLQRELEIRRIRAPIQGRVAEAVAVRPGSVVEAGDRVTSIVPGGDLRIAAEFTAGEAIGHIRAGQNARVRLDGFSSLEYGTIVARVEEVAVEPRNGLVRVELRIVRAPDALPLQHGIPGVVEIETERVAPVTIFLRGAGKRLQAI